ncbi:MAG: phage terminase large subunit family protein [Fusobacteriaceae bacterium]|nr:phage terminase large subunit family protein [Fusobacteriaceae bacterium]
MEQKTVELLTDIYKSLAPPRDLKVWEWADQTRILSKEGSSQPGKWNTDKTPYLKRIMEVMSDPEVERVILMLGSQLGKTEAILNYIGRRFDIDPCPILFIQPSKKIAEQFSKERIIPLFRDTEVLAKKTKGTLLRKETRGGYLVLVSSKSTDELASKPIEVVLADEIDRYVKSAQKEGSPIALAEARTKTFWNRKIILASTPTIKGESAIEKEYHQSSMEEWCVPCPSCGEYQPFNWEMLDFETAHMTCNYCACMHSEAEWKSGEAKWIERIENKKIKGFHLGEMGSTWRNWKTLIEEFLKVKEDQEKLQVFYNTSLAKTWELKKNSDFENAWKEIMQRAEAYEAELPSQVLILTASVDVQKDRLEVNIIGWGVKRESWSIRYKILTGNPEQPEVWNKLTTFLQRKFKYKDGTEIPISLTCIDTGDHTTQVYEYLTITPIKAVGIKGQGGAIPAIHKISDTNNYGLDIIMLGVDALKDTFFSLIEAKPNEYGYCHYPIDKEHNEAYYKSLMSEEKRLKWNPETGMKKLQYVKIRARNEGLDLRNYAFAALLMLNVDLEYLEKMEKENRLAILNGERKQTKKRILSKGVSSE